MLNEAKSSSAGLNEAKSPEGVNEVKSTPDGGKNQTEASQTPQAEHPNNGGKSKLPLVLIIILLILLIPLGGYFLFNEANKAKVTPVPTQAPKVTEQISPTVKPTLDPTADWKDYTNSKSGYSVKYPSDLYVKLNCPGEELVLRTRTAKDTKDEETFETCGRGGRFTIEVVTADSFTEPATDDFISVTKSEIEVGGLPAREYISIKKPAAEGPIPDYSDDIYVDHKGKHHLIHFDKGVSSEVKSNFLTSFRFLY